MWNTALKPIWNSTCYFFATHCTQFPTRYNNPTLVMPLKMYKQRSANWPICVQLGWSIIDQHVSATKKDQRWVTVDNRDVSRHSSKRHVFKNVHQQYSPKVSVGGSVTNFRASITAPMVILRQIILGHMHVTSPYWHVWQAFVRKHIKNED